MKVDLGHRVTIELIEIRTFYRVADEAYRELRTLLTEPNPFAETIPVEWVPCSDN
jgi:hypothetical protein